MLQSGKVTGAQVSILAAISIPLMLLWSGLAVSHSVEASSGQSEYEFVIWPEDSEISDSWYASIRVKICPNPHVSYISESATNSDGYVTDPKTGQHLVPNAVTVSFNITRDDGAHMTLTDHYGSNNDFCDGVSATYFEPDGAGVWHIRAKAEWISASDSLEVQRLESNVADVTVSHPMFETVNSRDLILPVPVQQLHDWSPDGKSIIVTYPEEVQNSTFTGSIRTNLGLVDTETYEISKVGFPKQFSDIYNARFSPSGSEILFLAHFSSYEPLQLFKYRFEDSALVQLTNSTDENSVNIALWISDAANSRTNLERIIYDEVKHDNDRNPTGYTIWLAESDGTRVKKLFEKQLGVNEYIFLNDISKDGRHILMTFEKGVEFPTVLFNLTRFEIETAQSQIIATNPERVGLDARFSPAGDLVLHTTPGGYRTPGGPIVIQSPDGDIHERIGAGEAGMAGSPGSFVVSPDGQSIVALTSQWGSGQSYLARAEFVHPIPEFRIGLVLVVMMLPIISFIIISRLRLGFWWNRENMCQ